jgi:alpha-ketoglutarate-dependent taurine dioxygenase
LRLHHDEETDDAYEAMRRNLAELQLDYADLILIHRPPPKGNGEMLWGGNFGSAFRVETKPDPNNLAYTAHALALHTDLPNQEMPPGFQFLHCVRNEASGGASVFADAFHIAEKLRRIRVPSNFCRACPIASMTVSSTFAFIVP